MDPEGLWLVEFSTQIGQGTGVVVLTKGKILGGDSNYYYTGDYVLNGTIVRGTLTTTHYNGPPTSVFGPSRSVTLSFEGAAGGDLIMAHGFNLETQYDRATFRLNRVKII